MNVIALQDFQNELLKPFAPSQEFALLTLIIPQIDESTVVEFCTEIQYSFPHVAGLYDAYANVRPLNAVPLIVPVAEKTNVLEEIFVANSDNVSLTEDFLELISTFVSRVPEHESSPDELFFGSPDRYVRLTAKEISAAIMQGFFSGALPITVTKTKGAFWRNLFPSAA